MYLKVRSSILVMLARPFLVLNSEIPLGAYSLLSAMSLYQFTQSSEVNAAPSLHFIPSRKCMVYSVIEEFTS